MGIIFNGLGLLVMLQVNTLKPADLIIGDLLIPGAEAPKLVTRDMIKSMKRGSVIVDVAIDQGGCVETSKPTTHGDPTYIVDDVVHYCVQTCQVEFQELQLLH